MKKDKLNTFRVASILVKSPKNKNNLLPQTREKIDSLVGNQDFEPKKSYFTRSCKRKILKFLRHPQRSKMKTGLST